MCLPVQVPRLQDPGRTKSPGTITPRLVRKQSPSRKLPHVPGNIQAVVVHLWPRPVSQVPRNRIERHLGETAAWGQITTVVRIVVSFAMHEGARVESSPTWKRPIKRPTDDEASLSVRPKQRRVRAPFLPIRFVNRNRWEHTQCTWSDGSIILITFGISVSTLRNIKKKKIRKLLWIWIRV